MRVIQASPTDPTRAIELAWTTGAKAIAWDLREECAAAVEEATSARLRSEGWYSAARDPEACAEHPEWMHMPQHDRWQAGRFADSLVAPYICLNNRDAADHARAGIVAALRENSWCSKLWLADVQGPPSGCGCGNLCCRSWDNSPGEKLVPASPADLPDQFWPELFFEEVINHIWDLERAIQVCPILCPECEWGFALGGVDSPDGPQGTNLCGGIRHDATSLDYWPELLERFRRLGGSLFVPQVGLLLLCEALRKNHPVYGAPRNWPVLAHSHYGLDLFPCIEPADATKFNDCAIVLDAPQTISPKPAPTAVSR